MSALASLRVIELSNELTADAGRLLAELGADVIAVEPPEGSALRERPPFAGDRPGPDRSLPWWAANAGKRSVTLDLDTEPGRRSFAHLVASASVVVESRGRDLDRTGVGWDTLGSEHGDLIWVSITPFGRDSARASNPFTDLTLLAGGGPLWNCGYDDHRVPPVRGAGDQSYKIGGLYAAIGALVALAHRRQTGNGQLVDVNVNAACNVSSEHTTYNWLVARNVCTRQTGRHAMYVPTSPVQVRCADGRYATTGVLPRDPKSFAALHAWLEELDLAADLPEAVFLQMAAERDEPVNLAAVGEDDETTAILAAAREAISRIAASLAGEEFFLQSQRRGLPSGVIRSADEAFEDEQAVARGFRFEVDHPELESTYLYPGVPYLFSATPCDSPRRPPSVGEHNSELLP